MNKTVDSFPPLMGLFLACVRQGIKYRDNNWFMAKRFVKWAEKFGINGELARAISDKYYRKYGKNPPKKI